MKVSNKEGIKPKMASLKNKNSERKTVQNPPKPVNSFRFHTAPGVRRANVTVNSIPGKGSTGSSSIPVGGKQTPATTRYSQAALANGAMKANNASPKGKSTKVARKSSFAKPARIRKGQ